MPDLPLLLGAHSANTVGGVPQSPDELELDPPLFPLLPLLLDATQAQPSHAGGLDQSPPDPEEPLFPDLPLDGADQCPDELKLDPLFPLLPLLPQPLLDPLLPDLPLLPDSDPDEPLFPDLPLLPHPPLDPLFPDFPELLDATQAQWPPPSGGLGQSPDPEEPLLPDLPLPLLPHESSDQAPDPEPDEPDLPLFPLLAHSPTDSDHPSSLTGAGSSTALTVAIVINAVANGKTFIVNMLVVCRCSLRLSMN